MKSLQKEEQHKLIVDMRAGRLTRRTFLRRAKEVGLASIAIAALLEGCASSPSSITINWIGEGDVNGSVALNDLAQVFSAVNENNIQVHQTPGASYTDLVNVLKAHQKSPEILSLDVVWVSKFAANNWVVALDDYWPPSQRGDHLPVPLQAASYEGKLYGAPHHTDVGVLYYRTDVPDIVIPTELKTWDDLTRMAALFQAREKTRHGYVWQGKQYEGMVCNFVEVLSGYGGAIFDDPRNPKKVVVGDNPGALQALTEMVNWVNTISPDVTKYSEESSADKWISGDAAFMRNWPAAITNSTDDSKTKIAGKFQVMSLPSSVQSCLGGWQLAINRFAEKEKQDAAWMFIQWMLQENAQQYLAIKEAFPVTLAKIYDDPYVHDANPFYAGLKPIINNAQFRPVSPHYQCIANAIEYHIYRALTDQRYYPVDALYNLQLSLESILKLKPTADDNCAALLP